VNSDSRYSDVEISFIALAQKTQRVLYADNTVLITVADARDKNYSPLSQLVGTWSEGRQVFEYLNLPFSRAQIRAR